MSMFGGKGNGFFKREPEERIKAKINRLEKRKQKQIKREELLAEWQKKHSINKEKIARKTTIYKNELEKAIEMSNIPQKKEKLNRKTKPQLLKGEKSDMEILNEGPQN
jgi:hypothetical protein